ncbi:hypothetical protein [Streptomyces sp. NBC_01276]|uniref:hypothetical protein n=1 Tax=Streptomyces sp. NBC_01276 TaxID=2903808 RepID=UPI00352E3DD7
MVTARAQHLPPARRPAGLLHLLGLALLLLGLICTHGAHAPGASAHPAAAASVSQASPADGHGPSHPADECAPVPPRQGSVVDAPASPSAAVTRCTPEVRRGLPGCDPAGASGSAPARTAAPPVLRV